MITGGSANGLDITISLNDRWAEWPHQCAIVARGPISASNYVSCNANRASVTVYHHDTDYDVVFMALDDGRWVESAPITVRTDPAARGTEPTSARVATAAMSTVAAVPVALFVGLVTGRRRRPTRRRPTRLARRRR